MKKILTFALACVMLTSVFAVNVFADTLVGSGDGVDEFNPTASEGSINVTVSDVTHRYAVDIVFTNTALEIPGVVWDVNALNYVEVDADAFDDFNDMDFVVTITNRSDLAVQASVAVTDLQDGDAITFTASAGGVTGAMTGNALDGNIVSATINAAAVGSAAEAEFTIDMECTNFHTASTYYKDKTGDDLKAASYTVTVKIP